MQKAFLPRLSRRYGLAIVAIIGIGSFLIRTLPLYEQVIRPDHVRFQGIDPYYHVRLTKYLVEHYPHRLTFDPLRRFPSGQGVDVYPAFDFVSGTAAVLIGLGSPSERTVELVAAFVPPILGLITTIAIGICGILLAGSWGGIAGALVTGFLPGGILAQTMIGYFDHHALETALLSVSWLLLVWVFRMPSDVRRIRVVWGFLGAISAAYALTWEGGPILPMLICGAVGIFVLLRTDQDTQRVLSQVWIYSATGGSLLLVASYLSPMVYVSLSLIFLLPLLPLLMNLIIRTLPSAQPALQRLAWLGSLVAFLALLYQFLPQHLKMSLVTNIGRLLPSGHARTVAEMRPLYIDPWNVWNFFGAALPWSLIGILISLRFVFRREGNLAFLLPVVTGLFFIPAAIMQTRFASASSLSLALLSISLVAGLDDSSLWPRLSPRGRHAIRYAVAIVWLITVPLWSLSQAGGVIGSDRGPRRDWVEAMAWMKEHTARVSDTPPTNDDGVLERAYGVLNWWDSGYYIITLAGRIPISNPTQTGASAAAAWFLDSSATVLDDLRENSVRYITSDALVSMIPDAEGTYQGQFLALPTWAGRRQNDFVEEVFFPTPEGGFEKRLAYYPAYYRSLAYRLSFGGGRSVTPIAGATWIIKTEVRAISGSTFGKVVTASQSFLSYDAAMRFMSGSPQNTWTIAGFNPFSPSITLDELKGVREVFTSSDVALAHPALPRPVPMLSIFEVLPAPVQ